MKIEYYVVYGVGKTFGSVDAWKKAFGDFAKFLKKYKMELVFWGFSFGTTEDVIYVMKGNVEDYVTMMGSTDYDKATPIASGHRTNMVMVP